LEAEQLHQALRHPAPSSQHPAADWEAGASAPVEVDVSLASSSALPVAQRSERVVQLTPAFVQLLGQSCDLQILKHDDVNESELT